MRAAYPVGGVTEAVLVGADVRRAAQHLGRVLAVDRHLEIGGGRRTGELDLQVEGRAGEDVRLVDGIDRLAGGGGAQGAQHKGGAEDRQHAARVSGSWGRRACLAPAREADVTARCPVSAAHGKHIIKHRPAMARTAFGACSIPVWTLLTNTKRELLKLCLFHFNSGTSRPSGIWDGSDARRRNGAPREVWDRSELGAAMSDAHNRQHCSAC